MPAGWSNFTTDAVANRRAGGRRHYNAMRQAAALVRQAMVAKLMLAGGSQWGLQSQIARALGVDRATISRDVKKAKAAWREAEAIRRLVKVVLIPKWQPC